MHCTTVADKDSHYTRIVPILGIMHLKVTLLSLLYAYVAVSGSSDAPSPANNDKQGGSGHGANAVVDRQTKNPYVVALDAEEEEGEAVDISGTRKRAKRTKAFVCDYFTKKIEKQ